MHQLIANAINAVDFQGGVLGNRQDAIVRKMTVPAMEQELELAA